MTHEHRQRRPEPSTALVNRHDRVTLTELAQILIGDLTDPGGRCQAFYLRPDHTATLIDGHGQIHTLHPADDGLYDLPGTLAASEPATQPR